MTEVHQQLIRRKGHPLGVVEAAEVLQILGHGKLALAVGDTVVEVAAEEETVAYWGRPWQASLSSRYHLRVLR